MESRNDWHRRQHQWLTTLAASGSRFHHALMFINSRECAFQALPALRVSRDLAACKYLTEVLISRCA